MSCSSCNNITIPVSNIPGADGADGATGAAGASVVSGSVDTSTGLLTLVLSDGTSINVTGSLIGPAGAAGAAKKHNAFVSTSMDLETVVIPQTDLTTAGFTMTTVYDFSYEIFQTGETDGRAGVATIINPPIDARVAAKISKVSVNVVSGDISITFKKAGSYTITFIGA
jgi:hypothetical protein